MKKWLVIELQEDGTVDEVISCLYEFTAHNPIRFVKKALKWYPNAFPHGFAFMSYPYPNKTWIKVKKKLTCDGCFEEFENLEAAGDQGMYCNECWNEWEAELLEQFHGYGR